VEILGHGPNDRGNDLSAGRQQQSIAFQEILPIVLPLPELDHDMAKACPVGSIVESALAGRVNHWMGIKVSQKSIHSSSYVHYFWQLYTTNCVVY
jgi:hypothetical protein